MEAEIAKMKKFQEFLGPEEKLVFHDLLDLCKIYASYASTMAYPVKEIPLLISMLFGQHKRIIELEKKVLILEITVQKPPDSSTKETQHGPLIGPAVV